MKIYLTRPLVMSSVARATDWRRKKNQFTTDCGMALLMVKGNLYFVRY